MKSHHVCFHIEQMQLKLGKKTIMMFCDNCPSQNKNRFFITMLWYALNKFKLDTIEQIFLVKGHTFNENDSVHSTIERAYKSKAIYTTHQWATVVQMAKNQAHLMMSMKWI